MGKKKQPTKKQTKVIVDSRLQGGKTRLGKNGKSVGLKTDSFSQTAAFYCQWPSGTHDVRKCCKAKQILLPLLSCTVA